MRAAVKWVNEYINYFNGDPERIVLSGQGTGASAATLLSMSDFTKGIHFIYNDINGWFNEKTISKQEK